MRKLAPCSTHVEKTEKRVIIRNETFFDSQRTSKQRNLHDSCEILSLGMRFDTRGFRVADRQADLYHTEHKSSSCKSDFYKFLVYFPPNLCVFPTLNKGAFVSYFVSPFRSTRQVGNSSALRTDGLLFASQLEAGPFLAKCLTLVTLLQAITIYERLRQSFTDLR